MTEQEAIKYLKDANRNNQMVGVLPKSDIGKRLINALEEVQQYRAIGTPEECMAAVEKQKEKKPSEQSCEEKTLFKCDNCGYIMKIKYSDGQIFGHSPSYCEQCGQKMDWSNKL